MDNIFNAKFIKSPFDLGEVCPIFFKEFASEKEIKSATLQISGLCCYEAKINGARVSDYVLAPGWTTYNARLQYQIYDVTQLIAAGQNIIEVGAGKGWRFHAVPKQTTDELSCDEIAIIACLSIEYSDNSKDIIYTDSDWLVKRSKILYSNMYNGETYDANAESGESFNAAAFSHPKEILIPQEGEIIKEQERLTGGKLFKTPKGETVIDFKQEITGYLEIRIRGKKGDKVLIKHFEMLDKKGNVYTENLRSARQELTIICSGEEFVYKPSFTFFGFRFIEISGMSVVNADDFTAVAVYSDMRRIGYFECSDPLLNKLYENIIWGQRGNFLDVPTDCPQRDERLGWTGDAQVFARVAAMNYDVGKFFKKWLGDMRAEQFDGGRIPHVIPRITWDGDSATAWADASCIVPWQVYLNYGDESILAENFELMKNWVDFMARRARKDHVDGKFKGSMNPYLWNCDGHFGDWLAVGVDNDKSPDYTSHHLIATAYFAYSTEILAKAGRILGKDMSFYEELHENIAEAFALEYLYPDGTSKTRTQTACVLAISFKLTNNMENLCKQLVEIVREKGCLMTGFVGTPYLLHSLDTAGETALAYDLIFRKEYPSWLYPVTMGSTTMWERWNSLKPDGSFADKGMNSFNHYAYGAVGDWMYGTIAGINYDEKSPGFKNILFKPVPDSRLTYAKATLMSNYGEIVSSWSKIDSLIEYTFVVPNGCSATATVNSEIYELKTGKNIIKC